MGNITTHVLDAATGGLMGNITTHVLDAASGQPAAGVPVALKRRAGADWQRVADGLTDRDGRCRDLTPGSLSTGVHRLVFDTGAYFYASGQRTFYPRGGSDLRRR